MSRIQYARARALVERIDAVVAENVSLRDAFVIDGADGWQMYRQRVFTIAKEWSKDPENFSFQQDSYNFKTYILHGLFVIRSLLALRRAKKNGVQSLVYTTDKVSTEDPVVCDRRIAELYHTLIDRKESFLEIVHGAYNRQTLANAKKRGRDVVYYEVLGGFPIKGSVVVPEYDTSTFFEDEKVCVQAIFTMTLRSVTQSKRVVERMAQICEWLGIKTVYGIDDARYYYEILHGAHKAQVSTAAVQHGHITKYHLGWLSYGETPYVQVAPQKFVVWSPYWKKELGRLKSHIPQSNIIVAQRAPTLTSPTIALKEGDLQLVFPYETDAPKDEVVLAIKAACACNMFSVIFKVRGDMSVDAQLQEYGLENFSHDRFIVDADVEPRPNMLIIGTYSSYLYDMIERMVPVAYLETSLDFGVGLVDNGLAERLVPGHMFCSDVIRTYETALKQCVLRKEKLVDEDAPVLSLII